MLIRSWLEGSDVGGVVFHSRFFVCLAVIHDDEIAGGVVSGHDVFGVVPSVPHGRPSESHLGAVFPHHLGEVADLLGSIGRPGCRIVVVLDLVVPGGRSRAIRVLADFWKGSLVAIGVLRIRVEGIIEVFAVGNVGFVREGASLGEEFGPSLRVVIEIIVEFQEAGVVVEFPVIVVVSEFSLPEGLHLVPMFRGYLLVIGHQGGGGGEGQAEQEKNDCFHFLQIIMNTILNFHT